MPAGPTLEREVHLNLIDSTRQLFELDSGATVEEGPGWLFLSGRAENPITSNIAFRTDEGLGAEELIGHARRFFGGRGRGFALWARRGAAADDDLLRTAAEAGLREVYEMPEMVLHGHPEMRPTADGVDVRRITDPGEAGDYWRVAQRSYASLGFPSEVFAFYDEDEGLLAGNVAAYVATLDGRPVAIAMTVVSHGVAGIYWVGTTEEARGRGLGRAATAAAVEAGLGMGPPIASLQASHMGEGLYRRMGFETIFSYALFAEAP